MSIRKRFQPSAWLRQGSDRPSRPPLDPGWVRLEQPLMGTEVSVELWHENPQTAHAAAAAVMAEYRRINAAMSTYLESSELSALNREAAKSPFVASAELFDLIARALELGRLSGGCFDITYDSVGFLYDLRAGIVPAADEVQRTLPLVNYRAVDLDPVRRTIRFRHAGMRVNLGGIGKGYAVERGATILREHGVRHGLLNAGGDSRVVGDRRGQPWIIGVRNPRDRNAVVARLPVVDEAISTAGDYERFFERDGQRIHHILDPQTGRPSAGVHSVTVIGPDGTMTDGLDTAIFVMGVRRGMELVATLRDYEAIIVDDQGQMFYSAGLLTPPSPDNQHNSID